MLAHAKLLHPSLAQRYDVDGENLATDGGGIGS